MADPAQMDDLPEVLRVPELAKLLRVNRNTAYDMIQARKIPGVRRVGRAIRIHRDTVIRWLASGHGTGR